MKKINNYNEKIWSNICWAKKVVNYVTSNVIDDCDDLVHVMRQIIKKKQVPGLPGITRMSRAKQIALVTVLVTGTFNERWDGVLRWYPSTTVYCCAVYRTVEKILKRGGNIWLYIEPEQKEDIPFLMNQDGELSDRAEALSRDIPRNRDIENELVRSLYTTEMWTEDGEHFTGVLF